MIYAVIVFAVFAACALAGTVIVLATRDTGTHSGGPALAAYRPQPPMHTELHHPWPGYLPAPPQTSPAGKRWLPGAQTVTSGDQHDAVTHANETGAVATRPGAAHGNAGPEPGAPRAGARDPAPLTMAAVLERAGQIAAVRAAPASAYLAELDRIRYDHSDATDSFAAITTGWT